MGLETTPKSRLGFEPDGNYLGTTAGAGVTPTAVTAIATATVVLIETGQFGYDNSTVMKTIVPRINQIVVDIAALATKVNALLNTGV